MAYIYLPKDNGLGKKEYEGQLGRVKIKVATISNEKTVEIVNDYYVCVKGDNAGEDYLDIVTRYFGKPTEKIEGKDSRTKNPVYVNVQPDKKGWMLLLGPKEMCLLLSIPPQINTATEL